MFGWSLLEQMCENRQDLATGRVVGLAMGVKAVIATRTMVECDGGSSLVMSMVSVSCI